MQKRSTSQTDKVVLWPLDLEVNEKDFSKIL